MQRAKSRSGQAILGSPVHMMTGRCCSSLRCLSVLKSQLCWTAQLLKGAETHFSPWGGAVPRGVRRAKLIGSSVTPPLAWKTIFPYIITGAFTCWMVHIYLGLIQAISPLFLNMEDMDTYFFSTLAINYSSYFLFLFFWVQYKDNECLFTLVLFQHLV